MTNSVTETALMPYIPEQRQVVQSKPKPIPIQIMEELGKILERWGNANDVLSQKIVNAGLKVLEYTCDQLSVPLDMEAAIEKVELIRQVLIYPRTKALFTDPWLVEGTATWEKSDLDEYRALMARFTNKTIHAEPHKFAVDVLNWLGKVPNGQKAALPLLEGNSSPVANTNTSLIVLPKDAQDYQCYMNYEIAIAQSKEIQQGLLNIREGKEMVMFLEKENVRIFQQFENTLQRQEDSSIETTKEQERSLKSLKAQHADTVNIYQQRDVEHQREIKNLTGEVKECKVQLNWQQQEIANLRARLQNCESNLWQARHELNDADSGGCTVM